MLMFFLAACGGRTPPPATPSPAPVSTVTSAPTAIPVTASPTPYTWCMDPLPEGFAIIGYLPEYQELNPEWGKCLTDLIYFSAEPRANGTLDTSRLSEDMLCALIEMKREHATRIHISIGGWERSAGFAPMVASAKTRAAFVKSLLAFATEHHLDGVDFDWEFPETETEFKNYIALLTETKMPLRDTLSSSVLRSAPTTPPAWTCRSSQSWTASMLCRMIAACCTPLTTWRWRI